MVQETDKIKDHIETQRGKLEQDLQEIEHRVTEAIDWREWFHRHPVAILGAAAAGGLALSLLLRRSPVASQVDRYAELDSSGSVIGASPSKELRKTSSQMNRMADTLDNAVAALLGVASNKVRDFVADLVPGFREEYREVEAKRNVPQSSPMNASDPSQMSAD